MNDSHKSRFPTKTWSFRYLLGVLGIAAALICLSIQLSAAQNSAQQDSGGATIQGRVLNPDGSSVGDALVQLRREDASGGLERKTNAEGVFVFSSLKSGNYQLSAEKSGRRSRTATVVLSSRDGEKQVDLVLEDSAVARTALKASLPASDQAMEFADKPSFTVAGVMDWSGAGGHGSDTSLRTSEALTRETLTLKPKSSEQNTPDSAAGAHGEHGDFHRLAGELAESSGDPLTAVREYEQAARLDPSEQNYFAWGSELLLHRAVLQAQEVFGDGAKAYPQSARMLTALGTALFAGARYDEAALRLCQASDLNPADPEPYMFMGKIEIASPNPLACIEEKLARFAREQPGNSQANYYYAMAVWKGQAQPEDKSTMRQVETLLTKAVTIDAKCADAYLQLGILAASQHNLEKAIDYYTQSIEANPQLADAHYRLGVAYDRIDESAKARQEFQLHDEIKKQQAADAERQRQEVKQFLVSGQPIYPKPQ